MKNTFLYSVLFLKCPRCRKGNLLESHPYKLSNFNKVKDNCPECGLKYNIEPSFFYGSMYVSYALGVAVAIAIYVVMFLLGYGSRPLIAFIGIVVGLAILFPYIGALSKSIWAHMFIKYDPNIAEKVHNKR